MRILSLILLLIFATPAFSATYYVALDGLDTNDGSTDSPWRTITHAAQSVSGGDIVVVRPGDYGERTALVVSGEPDGYIEFRAESGAITNRFTTGSQAYVKISGFKFDGEYPAYAGVVGISSDSHHILIEDCYFENDNNTSDTYGMMIDGYSCVIRNNIFNRFHYPNISLSGHDNIFEYNTIQNTNHDAMRIYGYNQIIRFNEFKDMYDDGTTHVDLFQTFDYNSHDILIENNFFHDCQAQIGNFTQDGNDNIYGWTWRNNIFANISLVANIYAPKFEFYNNTFYYSGRNTSGPLTFRLDATRGNAYDCKVKNNLFIGCGSHPDGDNGWYSLWASVEDMRFEGDYNYVTGLRESGYPPKTEGFDEVHGINGGDPKFIDIDGLDFHTASDSPAVDSGIPITGFNIDYDGVTRPQGTNWDRGAFEYISSNIYWVAKDGSDDNDGSEGSPWATIQKAVNTVVPGDIVHVNAGSYSDALSITCDGTENQRILFDAKGEVVIQSTPIDFGLSSDPAHYVTWRGFTHDTNGIRLRGEYLIVENCTLRNGSVLNISFHPDETVVSKYCTVQNNTFLTKHTGSEQVMLTTGRYTENCSFLNNTFINNTDMDIFRLFGSGHTVKNNEIYGMDEGGSHADFIQVYDNNAEWSYNMTIEGNYIHDCTGTMFMLLTRSPTINLSNWSIRNNIFAHIDGVAQSTLPFMKWENNLFIDSGNNTNGPILLRNYNDNHDPAEYGWSHDVTIANNIFIGGSSAPDGEGMGWYAWADGVNPDTPGVNFFADHNHVTKSVSTGYAPKTGFEGVEANGVNGGDPMFIDINNNDYHIGDNSVDRDAGMTVAGFDYDKDGNTRVAPWDIGPYEYAGQVPPSGNILYTYGGGLIRYNNILVGE